MDPDPAIIAIFIALLFMTGLFVTAESAIVNVRREAIHALATTGSNPFARLLDAVLATPHRLNTYIAACQVGITLSSIALGFAGQWYLTATWAHWLARTITPHIPLAANYIIAALLVLLLLTMLQVLIGEIVPRSVAIQFPQSMALFAIVPLQWAVVLFHPMITLFNTTTTFVLQPTAISIQSYHEHIYSPEEIEYLATESVKSGLIEEDEHQLLHNVFRASELTAAELMVPRTRMVCADINTPLPDLLALATTSAHTRIPLYRETIDSIVGSVHLKDLFRLHMDKTHDRETILRDVSYVLESQPALTVWSQLQQENNYIAIVLDEFNGTAGMITVADLLEEIFGELQDEYDDEPTLITRGHDGCARLPGDMLIANVNEWFSLKLPDEEANTIGGLVMATLGRLPLVNDEIVLNDVCLKVSTINGTVVQEVCLYTPSDYAPTPLDETSLDIS